MNAFEQTPAPPPNLSAEPVKVKSSSKTNLIKMLTLFLIVVTVLIVVLIASKVFPNRDELNNKTADVVQTSPPPIEANNWQTYTSDKLQLTFSYPPGYIVDEPKDTAGNPIFIKDPQNPTPIAKISSKGWASLIRTKDGDEVRDTTKMIFGEFITNSVLANYDSTNVNQVSYGYKINEQIPFKNSFGLSGYSITPVIKTVVLGKTSYEVTGPMYVFDISALSSERALFVEPIYIDPAQAENKTFNELTFKRILNSIQFLTKPDETAGWKPYNASEYLVKYPPNWKEFKVPFTDLNSGDCVLFSDIEKPKDIPGKIDPVGHRIISSCLYQGEMPTSFPYTNGSADNDTIREFAINGYLGIRGQSTSALGFTDSIFLRKPSGGYVVIQNLIGDSKYLDLSITTFKFN